MPVKDYIAAIKARTIVLLVLSLLCTLAAVYLYRHQNHGCFDGQRRLPQGQVVLARYDASPRGRASLVRVQEQDEGAEIAPSSPPCPKNEDMNIAATYLPWLAVVLWIGFAASLQVDLDGRRKRRRKARRRQEESSTGTWPPDAPTNYSMKEDSRSE